MDTPDKTDTGDGARDAGPGAPPIAQGLYGTPRPDDDAQLARWRRRQAEDTVRTINVRLPLDLARRLRAEAAARRTPLGRYVGDLVRAILGDPSGSPTVATPDATYTARLARHIEVAEDEMRALPTPARDDTSGRGDDADVFPEIDAAWARARHLRGMIAGLRLALAEVTPAGGEAGSTARDGPGAPTGL